MKKKKKLCKNRILLDNKYFKITKKVYTYIFIMYLYWFITLTLGWIHIYYYLYNMITQIHYTHWRAADTFILYLYIHNTYIGICHNIIYLLSFTPGCPLCPCKIVWTYWLVFKFGEVSIHVIHPMPLAILTRQTI